MSSKLTPATDRLQASAAPVSECSKKRPRDEDDENSGRQTLSISPRRASGLATLSRSASGLSTSAPWDAPASGGLATSLPRDAPVAVYTNADCLLHELAGGRAGRFQPERPERIDFCLEAVETLGPLVKSVTVDVDLEAAQNAVQRLYEHTIGKRISLDTSSPDNCVKDAAASERAIAAAVSLVLRAVDDISPGSRSFCLCRPPGHHASCCHHQGFCFVNNVALAAVHAMRSRGCVRPAIVDFDIHLGEGTIEFVQKLRGRRNTLRSRLGLDDSVEAFYASVHTLSWPIEADTFGSCACVGGTFDCGRRGGAYQDIHLQAIRKVDHRFPAIFTKTIATFAERLKAFKPDVLFISAGFDAHADESHVRGSTPGFGLRGEHFKQVTESLLRALPPSVPCVSVLEGGYVESALFDGLSEHLRGLAEA